MQDTVEPSEWHRQDDVQAKDRRGAEAQAEVDLHADAIFTVVPARSWAPQKVVEEQRPVRRREAVDA